MAKQELTEKCTCGRTVSRLVVSGDARMKVNGKFPAKATRIIDKGCGFCQPSKKSQNFFRYGSRAYNLHHYT